MALVELRDRLNRCLREFCNENILNMIDPDYCLKEITGALREADFPESIVNEIERKIQEIINLPDASNKYIPIYQLCGILDPGKSALIQDKRERSVVMFIGLRGVGKVDTCAKYARYYLKKGFRPALVCADTLRTHVFVRLKMAAPKEIPVYESFTRDPVELASEGIEKYSKQKRDLIIIDTNGGHKQYSALFKEMCPLAETLQPDLVIFVMDSTIGQAAAFDQAQAFKQSFTTGVVIVTNLNSGNSKAGGVLCAQLAGTGEESKSNEFEAFEVEPFVKNLLRDLQHEHVGIKPRDYTYTLRKMYDYYRRQLGLDGKGPLFPSLRSASDPQLNLEKMRQYVTIMGSMTDEELDQPNAVKKISEKRVMEIAKGSKARVSQVLEMIKTYKKNAKGWQEFHNNTTPFKNWRFSYI